MQFVIVEFVIHNKPQYKSTLLYFTLEHKSLYRFPSDSAHLAEETKQVK